MLIYIMRHGEAELHASSDSERALTTKGEHDAIQAAKWLKAKLADVNFDRLDRVLVSPYLRARQTLNSVLAVLDAKALETLGELTPDGNEARINDYLTALAGLGINSVLVISHLPLVGYLISSLCPDVSPPMLSTSAIVGIDFNNETKRAKVACNYPIR